MNSKGGIVFYLLLATAAVAQGQTKPVTEVSVEKKQLLLGEPFQYRLQVHFPEGSSGQFPIIDSIPHFEFTQPPAIDSASENGGRTIKGIYYLTSFDSGHWVIPSYAITKEVKTDTIGIDILFADFNPEQPYHDIKDIIGVKTEKKTPWWWYAIGGGVLLLFLIIYLLRRKKKAPGDKPASKIDPYDEAIRQLEELQRTQPDVKQYHSRLTDIFRLYIFRRKKILSLQKTTDDLVLQLKEIGLPREEFEKLSQALRLSDFVKFAKYQPTEEDNRNVYHDMLNAIKAIEKSETKVSL